MLLFLTLLLAASQPAPPAEILFENGIVYVSADARPRKASIVVGQGRVLYVGDPARARRLGKDARVVDLSGRFVFPGWADAHLHLAGLGKAGEIANLRGASDAAEAAARMAKAAGIDAATRDPDGGRILRRPDGSPTGVLVDNAASLIAVPAATPADLERHLLAGAASCAASGLTQIQDASGYGPEGIAALERLSARGALPIRVYATVSPEPAEMAVFLVKGPRIGGGEDFLTVRAIKAYADGALGSRGAALLADYSDEPGRRGLMVTSPERLSAIALDARRAGWQLWIQAIGDRGNRVALDALEAAAVAIPEGPAGAARPRIEHAQVIALEDFPRFARFSVIASVQPIHATADMGWAEDRVGSARIAGAYAWRRLKTSGAKLAGGSDAPVESPNPLWGFHAAVTRQDAAGLPPGGWRAGEALTRREALALFTSDAAFAAFEEGSRGRIEAGFAADLTILERDPMTAPAPEIPGIPVSMTVVGGRIVHGGTPAP